jgi:DNA modification methylase
MKKNLQKNRIENKGKTNGVYDDRGFIDKPFSTIQGTLKPKDLVMIPNRIAIALQDDGWWIRSEIIWHKPNPMPESVRDRPTSAHEKIWLITKNKKYYYNADAIREPCTESTKQRYKSGWKGNEERDYVSGKQNHFSKYIGTEKSKQDALKGRNRRNVWTITTKPFRDAHFATFPKDLIEPCIKAGCPEKVCVECGKPQVKEFYRKEKYNPGYGNQHTPKGTHKKIGGVYQKWLEKNPPKTTIKPSCDCNADFKPGVVFDPFGGSGTTGIVAKSLNRKSIIIELNPEYIKIAKKRIEKELGLFG